MPRDNLTLRLKEELANQGFAATDQEIDNYLRNLKAPTESVTSLQSTTPLKGLPDWLSGPKKSESKINLIEGVGATAWNLFDTALFSLPGIAARQAGEDEIFGLRLDPEERGPAGKVGGVIGEAVGFLLPMKWISKGIGTGVRALSSKGGKTVLDDIIKGADTWKDSDSIYKIGKDLGFKDKSALKGALSRTFKSSDEGVKRGIAAYGVSAEAIKQTKSVLKSNIGVNLKEAFPDASPRLIEELAEAVTVKLGEPGFHINTVGNWIQRVMNRKIGLDEAGNVSKYITHAGELTTNFAMYNLLTNGIHTIAGEAEFDPVGSVYDALAFSALLPFVEMIPGGGKVPIARTSKQILDYMRKYKKFDYSKYSQEELNGLIQIVGANSAMKNAPFWEKAFRNSGGKLDHKTAKDVLETMRKTANLDGMWREFAKEAGEDLGRSVGRMMVGAAYFNSHTLLDPNMIRNVDSEVLGAHMLVGAFFTRMRKPIFEKQSPYLENFEANKELLRNFGIDASGLKAANSYFTARNMLAGAQSGSLHNEKIGQIYDIMYDPQVLKDIKDRRDKDIGKEVEEAGFDINDPQFNILREGLILANVRRFNEMVREGKPEDKIELHQLTLGEAEAMKKRLEEVVIDKEKGLKLTEENFDDYYLEVQNELQLDGAKTIVNRLVEIARILGVSREGKASEFNFDKQNVRIADIEGNSVSENMQHIVEFQKILNRFKTNGTIGNYEPFMGKTYEQLENDPKLQEMNSNVEAQLKLMVQELRDGSFGKDTHVDINPSENAWLDLMDTRQSFKTLTTIYDIARGRGFEKPVDGNEKKSMWKSTKSVLGDKLPPEGKINSEIKIDTETKPEGMKKERWNEIKADELTNLEKDLQSIAKMWATHEGNRDPNHSTTPIRYDEALSLVELYKNRYPRVFKDNFLDRLNNYHQQREFKDVKLGNRESGILFLAKQHNLIQKSEDGNEWTMMDRNGVEKYIQDQIPSDKVRVELLSQFDKIRGALSRIDGKYIKFVTDMELSGPNQSNVEGFIREAHGLTRESFRDVMKSYESVLSKTSLQGDYLARSQAIIDKLYDTETEEIKKLSFSDTTEISLEIKNLISDSSLEYWVKKDGKKIKKKDEAVTAYFERLLDAVNLWQKGSKDKDFSISENNYLDGNKIIMSRANKLGELQKQIIKMQVSSGNTMWGQRNSARMKDEIVGKLAKELKDLKIDVGRERSLEEIYEWYNLGEIDSKTNIDNYIKEFRTRHFAFERNMSPEQYELLRQEVARNREVFESNFDKTPKETYQSIENKYGEHNEKLTGDNYQNLKDNIVLAIEAKSGVKKAARELLDEVHKAIENKNRPDYHGPPSPKLLNKIKNQKAAFNERFPGVLAQSYGTDVVKHISFSENGKLGGNQVELIIEGKTEAAGAESVFFNKLLEEQGVSLYKVGRNSVYGNTTYTDFASIPVAEAKKNGWFESPENVKEGDVNQRGFTGVKLTVSKWDQLYLKTSDIKGEVAKKFKEGFDRWYDDIFGKLPDDQSRTNFEKMYGHLRTSEQITLKGNLREAVKAQYWSHLTEAGFIDTIQAAASRSEMNKIAVKLLKYFHYMKTAGPQIRGSQEFLNKIRDIGNDHVREHGYFWNSKNGVDAWAEVQQSIVNYNNKPNGFNILSIKEDAKMGGLSAYDITKNQLEQRLKKATSGTDHYRGLKTMIAELEKGDKGAFASILKSGIDAQSWLGTDAANISYLHRGRTIHDDLAGIKPTGYSNLNDILLKTNFIYDRNIAEILKNAKIDILTTETAAKRFGAGHTELMVQGKPIQAKDYKSYLEAFTKSEESLKNGIKSNLRVEDLFFGKTTDRHLANVSYNVLNFLDKAGYGEFTKHVGYYDKITNAVGMLNDKVLNQKSTERNFEFMNTLRMAREEGDIFSDGTSGSIERLISVGADVQADALLPDVQRIITRRILGEITKPKTPWGSHSVLIPYLEGKIPVYGEINGQKKQIVYGGKKLSYHDGEIAVQDIKKLKFVVEYTDLTPGSKKDRYDIQIGFDKDGVMLVNHPVTGEKLKDKVLYDRLKNTLDIVGGVITRNNGQFTLKNVHDQIRKISRDPLRNKLGYMVNGKNKIAGINMYLHSLSLRVPNIGGDVAVHKVEGFYEREIGNVVGINPMDLSVKHQGDFDVDMADSYHELPWAVSRSITDNTAKTPDAKVYPAFPKDFDMFNMGDVVGPVGVNENMDTLEKHYNNYHNAQSIFGSIMNIAPGIGSLERIGFKVGGKDVMMKINSPEFVPVKQRLKNVLQSIIDATQTDNFASLGTREEVLKFVLFGKKMENQIDYSINEYGEAGINTKGWEGMFKLPEELRGTEKGLIVEDAIIKSLSIVNSSNRVLSGVTDEAGRRPPDLSQMMRIRNKIDKFLRDPGTVLFNDLLFDYKVLNYEKKKGLVDELLDLFYDMDKESHSNEVEMRTKIFSKKQITPRIKNRKLFKVDRETTANLAKTESDGKKLLHKVGVGGVILDKFGTHLNDKTKWVKRAMSNDSKQAYNVLDRIEASFLLADHSKLESLMLKNELDASFRESLDMEDTFADFGDVFKTELAGYGRAQIQKYSLLNHIIDKESNSLKNFIDSNSGAKHKTNSLVRAQFKLKTIEQVKDFLLDKEVELVDGSIDAAKKGNRTEAYKHFKFKDYDLSKSKSGMNVFNSDANTKYIYYVQPVRNGRVKYSFYGTLSPGAYGSSGKKFLRKGRKYVVMENPIRHEMLSEREVKDAFALLDVTGEAVAANIENITDRSIDSFYDRLGQLRKDMYEIRSEAFKMSNKSAFASRNWTEAAQHETKVIKEFFEQTRKDIAGEGELTNEAIFTISSILLKPRQTSSMVKLSKTEPIEIPSFKVNKRMLMSVERYLSSFGEKYKDIYDSIFKAYGKAYRLRNDRIIDSREELMYKSDLYQNGSLYPSRSPALDLAYGTYGYMYIPSILQSVRGELQKHGGRVYKTFDTYGNVRRMVNYDRVGKPETLGEYYSSDKFHRDAVDTKERCN